MIALRESVCIQSYSGLHFPEFELNTEKYGVYLLIQSECGKIGTRITTNMDTFHVVVVSDHFSIKSFFHLCLRQIFAIHHPEIINLLKKKEKTWSLSASI